MQAQPTQAEQYRFEAEVDQLLHLVVHSLYSNPEVFLRELVSNASDALDKLRFRALTDPSLLEHGPSLQIHLRPSGSQADGPHTLVIEDTGIGMTREELVRELGTIARSGTKAFVEAAKQAAENHDARFIGQFGVGFYSAFLVADRVEVVSRAAGADDAWRWISDAKGSFSVEPAERSERGTAITLFLREEHHRFSQSWTVSDLVRKYSDFVQHPILLHEPPKSTADSDEGEEGTQAAREPQTLNRGKALWTKSKSEITNEEYNELYKHVTHDWDEPLAHTHFTVEGHQQFTGILYIPKRPPFDLFMPDQRRGVRLHVRRVFVMDDCDELLPQWLRFVRGIIDSDDLPLNVSREILQDSATTRAIRKAVTKRTLDLLEQIATDEPDKYKELWSHFGAVLKEGLGEYDVQDRLVKLARFHTSHESGFTSLTDYVARMPEAQSEIYTIVGRSVEALQNSPHLEAVRKRGWEVLYLTDVVDEWALQSVREFEGKKLVSAMQANLKGLSGDEEGGEDARKAREEAASGVVERFKATLQDKVSEVRLSDRLTDSPVCLVVPDGGMSAQMEQLLRAHRREVPPTKRVLEINPTHALIVHLADQIKASGDQVDAWIELLYEQALLTEGSPLPDPNAFARRMTKMLENAIAAAA